MLKKISAGIHKRFMSLRIIAVQKGLIKTGWVPLRRRKSWFLTHSAMKKSLVFAATFVLVCIVMGNRLIGNNENSVAAQATGSMVSAQSTQYDTPKTANLLTQFFFHYDERDSHEYYEPEKIEALDEHTFEHVYVYEYEPAELPEFVFMPDLELSEPLQRYTYQLCAERGLEYDLVLALMWRESRFRIDTVSLNTNGTTDSGIMQINDVNREWLLDKHDIHDLMDPYQNILAGVIMLEQLMQKYEPSYALIAYQYGEAGMLSKVEQGTANYGMVRQLRDRQEYYRQKMIEFGAI